MSEEQAQYRITNRYSPTGHVRTCRCDACVEYWALKDMRRDCDTCGRPKPGTQVCPMPNLDIDTCLGNPSRPFWRPVGWGNPSRPPRRAGDCISKEDVGRVWDFVSQRPWFDFKIKMTDEPEYVQPDTQDLIREECNSVLELLLEKNRKYGDSAIHPVRIFSKADPVEQINVRMDDKLSRVKSAQGDDTEDPELDLIGYLILKRVAKRKGAKE